MTTEPPNHLSSSSLLVCRTLCVVALVAGLASCASSSGQASSERPPWEGIANAHGFREFGQVEKIDFTFNVEIGERSIARSWSWEPFSGAVTYRGPGPDGEAMVHTYNRGSRADLDAPLGAFVDGRFINDSFWLLFPLHLRWDEDAAIEVVSTDAKMPIGEARGLHLRVRYDGGGGGYTPGDVYEVFADDELRVVQWVFNKEGKSEDPRPATWEAHQKFGPLLIATDHRSADGTFRLWFSDLKVSVK